MTKLARHTWIDDDGSGNTGTPIINAALQGDVYDPVDAALASLDANIAGLTPGTAGWIRVPFLASDYGGNGSMTWTVAAANIVAFDYKIDAQRTCFLKFDFANTTVGGTASNLLLLTLPAAIKPAAGGIAPCLWSNIGANYNIGLVSMAGGNAQLSLFMTANFGTTWALGTARVAGQLFYGLPGALLSGMREREEDRGGLWHPSPDARAIP